MWTSILLFILKLLYKKEIKDIQRANPGISSDQAFAHLGVSKILKNKRKIRLINTVITISLLSSLLFVGILVIALSSFRQHIAAVSTLVSMDFFEEPKIDEDGNVIDDGWSWEEVWDKLLDNGGVDSDGSGGAYPKDVRLKVRAQFIEIAERSAKSTGKPIDGSWLIGVGTRETNGGQYEFNGANNANILTDLVMTADPCGWLNSYNKCSYIENGISHYVGGTVSKGRDNGSPYTMNFDSSESKYNIGRHLVSGGNNKQTIGHAIGPFQFEIRYIYDVCRYKFEESSVSKPIMDNEIGFLRPNPLYIPDSLQSNAMMHSMHWETAEKNSKVLNTNEFKSLSAKNQNIIKFSLAGSMYGVGGWRSWMDDFAKQLISVAKTKELDMILSDTKYWSDGKLAATYNTHSSYIVDFQNAGIKWTYNPSSGLNQYEHYPWSGLAAVNLGRIEQTNLNQKIAIAEKDGNSGGISGGIRGSKVSPVNVGYISSQYGYRSLDGKGNAHAGCDIAGNNGAAIYVPVDCKLISANSSHVQNTYSKSKNSIDDWYGNHVILQPVENPSLKIIIMHMSTVPFVTGDNGEVINLHKLIGTDTILTAGTPIGFVGNSGNSNGAHLHFEVQTTNANDMVSGQPRNGANTVMGTSIPPFHALFGSDYAKILMESGIQIGGGKSESKNNDTLTWRGIRLRSYYIG